MKPSISGIWPSMITSPNGRFRDRRLRSAVSASALLATTVGVISQRAQHLVEDAAVRRVVVDDEHAEVVQIGDDAGRRGGSRRVSLEARGEVERAADADLALDPDRAAHQRHELGGDRQAEPGAAELPRGRGVGLRERLEDRRRCLSGGMPMPVSVTAKCSATASGSIDCGSTCTTTSPRSVNLIALPTRFMSTCRSRPGSPTSRVRHVGADVAGELEALLLRAQREHLHRVVDRVAEPKADVIELELARLDLREVEDVVDDVEQRLGRLARSSSGTRAARR